MTPWSTVDVHARRDSRPSAAGRDDPHSDVSADVEWQTPSLTITAKSSRCPAGGWCGPHERNSFGIGLVRHGAWQRRINGVETIVDPVTGYCFRPGETIEVAHFNDEVHTGTIIDIDPEQAAQVLAELAHVSGPFVVSPQIDLAHRMLIAACRSADSDAVEIEERTLTLIAAVVAQRYPRFPCHARRATSTARRRVVTAVCEHLYDSHDVSLVELARAVHYSPFHVSRVFREVVGVTISEYRTRLRMHQVLLRLDEGAPALAQLAAETGFADHSHMTRTLVAQVGLTPSALRERLNPGR